jgi:hypothetical protein
MLTGESAPIRDLVARLYVAPVDAAGNVGRRNRPKSRPPSKGNVFAIIGIAYQTEPGYGRDGGGGRWQLRVDWERLGPTRR